MQIWNYHPTTGELLGASVADPNPVEPGEWLIPAHATATPPSDPQAERVCRFKGGGWESVPDCRGQTWWKADAKDNTVPVQIDFIGDPEAWGLTSTEPPAPPVVVPPVVVSARQIRQALSVTALRVSVEGWVQAADQDTKDNWQFGAEFVQGHSLIDAAAEDLGWPLADVGELFTLAKSL
jgi:hypothetical protein